VSKYYTGGYTLLDFFSNNFFPSINYFGKNYLTSKIDSMKQIFIGLSLTILSFIRCSREEDSIKNPDALYFDSLDIPALMFIAKEYDPGNN
jgi:hypothetical protein